MHCRCTYANVRMFQAALLQLLISSTTAGWPPPHHLVYTYQDVLFTNLWICIHCNVSSMKLTHQWVRTIQWPAATNLKTRNPQNGNSVEYVYIYCINNWCDCNNECNHCNVVVYVSTVCTVHVCTVHVCTVHVCTVSEKGVLQQLVNLVEYMMANYTWVLDGDALLHTYSPVNQVTSVKPGSTVFVSKFCYPLGGR